MEVLIGLLSGVGAAGAMYLLKKIGAIIFVTKYGAIVKKVFDVLDPVAGQLIESYDESEVQKGIELAVAMVGDSKLDHHDLEAISKYVLAKFDPKLAAAKAIVPDTKEGKASIELVKSVASLKDGASFTELVRVAQNTAAMV